jgi:N-methylhydantoinase A/oxoprolinase/acetone carboxylase beta subunit
MSEKMSKGTKAKVVNAAILAGLILVLLQGIPTEHNPNFRLAVTRARKHLDVPQAQINKTQPTTVVSLRDDAACPYAMMNIHD